MFPEAQIAMLSAGTRRRKRATERKLIRATLPYSTALTWDEAMALPRRTLRWTCAHCGRAYAAESVQWTCSAGCWDTDTEKALAHEIKDGH